MDTTIALAGNPNAGKTTLFNALTGARQHVGNYPGVTVEKKEGMYVQNGTRMAVVDLPGTYSLSAYSLEEVVARDFLTRERPDVVVNIVDASNLERHLYLTLQFLELGMPVCLALNMIDVAEKRGIHIDADKLSSALGVPVVPIVAREGRGITDLMKAVKEKSADRKSGSFPEISYGPDVDAALGRMEKEVADAGLFAGAYPARWVALKYLEGDEAVVSAGREADPNVSRSLEAAVERLAQHLKATMADSPESMIVDYRYGHIKAALRSSGSVRVDTGQRLFVSDRIDQVVTQRFVGPILMVAVIYLLYQFTFAASEVPVSVFEAFFGWLGGAVDGLLPDGALKSLIVSGVIDGVGGVLGFTPLIFFMFFGISLLEDSGYLARVAFMLDRVFRVFGLHGSSVMAFIVSGGIAGGCAVPGVMATRILRSPKERLATLLTVPFMNCGAKMPVFVLLVGAFFAENQARMMMIITLIAWGGALLVAKLLRVTVIRGAATPFVMELPPYRLPTFKGLMIHTWERTWQYIKKAGTVILGISVLLWALMTYPGLPDNRTADYDAQRNGILSGADAALVEMMETEPNENLPAEARALKDAVQTVDAAEASEALRFSIAGRIGTAMESVSRLAGFDWRTNIALLGGFAAKEVVVSTLGTAYSLGEVDPEETGGLTDLLAGAPGWNPAVALALIIFTIFYAPCFVAVVCIAREAGSWKWGAFSMIFNTLLAFGLSVLVYQAGCMIGGY